MIKQLKVQFAEADKPIGEVKWITLKPNQVFFITVNHSIKFLIQNKIHSADYSYLLKVLWLPFGLAVFIYLLFFYYIVRY